MEAQEWGKIGGEKQNQVSCLLGPLPYSGESLWPCWQAVSFTKHRTPPKGLSQPEGLESSPHRRLLLSVREDGAVLLPFFFLLL